MQKKYAFEEALARTIRGKLGRIEYLVSGGKGEPGVEQEIPAHTAACYARDALHQAKSISEDLDLVHSAVFSAYCLIERNYALLDKAYPYDSDGFRPFGPKDTLRGLRRAESLCCAIRERLGRDIDAELCGLLQSSEDAQDIEITHKSCNSKGEDKV